MLSRLWLLHRRFLLIVGGLLTALLLLVVGLAVVLHYDRGRTRTQAAPPVPAAPSASTVLSAPPNAAADVARWNSMPAVDASPSTAYPAIPEADRNDPTAFARAFSTELFTRDYSRCTRTQLLQWAQYEDAPLRSRNYPQADWSKVLVDSLTDLSWDSASASPIPPDGQWLALRSERATDSVSDVVVALDPEWERRVADGYQPPDPLATVRDVSLTVTERVHLGQRVRTSRYDVALAIQLGTSPSGGYGVAATNNYVVKEHS